MLPTSVGARITAALLVALTITAASCGGDGGEAEGRYCDALREMAALQPVGVATPEEFEADYLLYADAVERAAEVAPSEHEDTLRELAGIVRIIADDPGSPEVAERIGDLFVPMFVITRAAEQDCGVDFDAAASE